MAEAAVIDVQSEEQADAESALQFQDFGGSATGSLTRSSSTHLKKSEQIHNFNDFPDTPGSDDEEAPENAELLRGEKIASQGPPSIWSLAYYQSFFDVDTRQVLRRIMWSMIPLPGSNYLQSHIRPNPDLYGPFWICATLVFSTAISGNFANYLQTANSGNYQWKYDFHKVSIAATVIYVYASLIPLALWVILWYRKSEAKYTLLEVLCIYGYSLSIYIPISVLWVVPINFLQWALVFIGAILSGSVLLFTMWPAFKDDQRKISLLVMVAILALHLLLAVGFVMYFFHNTPMKTTIPVTTKYSTLPATSNASLPVNSSLASSA